MKLVRFPGYIVFNVSLVKSIYLVGEKLFVDNHSISYNTEVKAKQEFELLLLWVTDNNENGIYTLVV